MGQLERKKEKIRTGLENGEKNEEWKKRKRAGLGFPLVMQPVA